MRAIYFVIDESDLEAARTTQLIRQVDRTAEVVHARSIASALEALEVYRTVPSLIFADCLLPDGDGFDLLRAVRGRRWLEGAPVAMLSRPVNDRLIVTCYKLGACAFLLKPARSHELREVIREFGRPALTMPAGSAIGPFAAGTARHAAA